jgi:hypothetical protein
MDWDIQKVMYSNDYYPPKYSRDIKIFSMNTLRNLSQEYVEIAEVVMTYCEYGEEAFVKGVFIQKAKEIAAQLGGDAFLISSWVSEDEECPQRMTGLVVKFTSEKK